MSGLESELNYDTETGDVLINNLPNAEATAGRPCGFLIKKWIFYFWELP